MILSRRAAIRGLLATAVGLAVPLPALGPLPRVLAGPVWTIADLNRITFEVFAPAITHSFAAESALMGYFKQQGLIRMRG